MHDGTIFSTASEISDVIHVNEKRTKALLTTQVIPCVTTGGLHRKRYYTTQRLIDYTYMQIVRKYGLKRGTYKEAFLQKSLDATLHHATPAHRCEVLTITNQ
jgi:hypothetical protein